MEWKQRAGGAATRRMLLSAGGLCAMLCGLQTVAAVFGDAPASSYVMVNESLTGAHELTDTGNAGSVATLSFLLGSAWSEVDIPHGTLKTFVQTSTSDVIGPTGAIVQATAALDDFFTVSGLPDIGTTHGILAELHVQGALVTPSRNSNSHYSGIFVDFAGGEMLQRELWPFPDGGEVAVDETLSHVFVVWPDQPFEVKVLMQSYGHGVDHYDIMSDFFGTASLRFTLPPGAAITSTGGFSLTAVPLPASFALLCPAVLALTAAGRRRAPARPHERVRRRRPESS